MKIVVQSVLAVLLYAYNAISVSMKYV